LELPPLEKIKLTRHCLFREGLLLSDTYGTADQLDDPLIENSSIFNNFIHQEILLFSDPEMEDICIEYYLPSADMDIIEALDSLIEFKGTDLGIYVLDDAIISIDTTDIALAEKVWRLINLPPPARYGVNRYQVSLSVTPVDFMNIENIDGITYAADPVTFAESYRELDPSIVFGRDLHFFLSRGAESFDWDPVGQITQVDDTLFTGHFFSEPDDEPVIVEIDIVCESGVHSRDVPQELIPYTDATDFWPVDSPPASDALADALADTGGVSAYDIAARLHQWIRETTDFPYDFETRRLSPEKLLDEWTAGAWARADLFNTLARTAGLQTRLVAGLGYYQDGMLNLVWTQVWLPEQGFWLDVDCENESVGIDSYYIPIWGSRDGDIAFIYTDDVSIERIP